ncbi:MAG: hypothetical protein J0H71_05510 [Rhizobiales bacterium]|nr:hypothetical protein [Hyphomicrobiales bacterium]
MRIVAEFVDSRNGQRYLPGDGNKINPPLTDDQIERLRGAGCLKDGDEAGRTAEVVDSAKSLLDAMTVADLKSLATYNNIDLGDATKKSDLIAKIDAELVAKELSLGGPTVGEWVAAGYKASAYPPRGYAQRSSQEEIEAAVAAENAQSN